MHELAELHFCCNLLEKYNLPVFGEVAFLLHFCCSFESCANAQKLTKTYKIQWFNAFSELTQHFDVALCCIFVALLHCGVAFCKLHFSSKFQQKCNLFTVCWFAFLYVHTHILSDRTTIVHAYVCHCHMYLLVHVRMRDASRPMVQYVVQHTYSN